jgi:hypothetical protein
MRTTPAIRGGMSKCLVTLALLYLGCGGIASTESEAPSQPASDDTLCAVTDGSIEAVWGGTKLTLAGTCGGHGLTYFANSSEFELCGDDGSGRLLVLGETAPGQNEYAQFSADSWFGDSVPGFALTVTAMRPPGHYVEGTFTGLVQDYWTSAPTAAKSLTGSFKVCRGPDEPLPHGRLPN